MGKIKILFVGSCRFPWYVKAFYESARKESYVSADLYDTDEYLLKGTNFLSRVQLKMLFGTKILRFNYELYKYISNGYWDILFFFSTREVYPGLIKRVRKHTRYIAMYNNDCIFSTFYPKYFWRLYKGAVRYSDIVYVFREFDIPEYKKIGITNVKCLYGYYIKERNYYDDSNSYLVDIPDVVFIGHYENDSRLDYLIALLDSGIDVGVPDYWKYNTSLVDKRFTFIERTHENYNKILNKAKIAVCFYSYINHDEYTTRCFEIPATGTLLVAPRSTAMKKFFLEDKEAVFFESVEEFVLKVKHYLSDDDMRERIAERGKRKVEGGGFEVADRVKMIINDYLDVYREDIIK